MGRILAIDYGTRRTGIAVSDPLRLIAGGLAGRLRRAWPDKEVVFYDERFTSVMAHRTMLESGIGRMARRDKALVDKISATIILQSYMESISCR